MRFYTKQECEEWLRGRARQKPDETPGLKRVRAGYPDKPYQCFAFAQSMIASSSAERSDVLLWITEWSIWPSSENWHLYYKLRQSFHDQRLLHEAPGDLFLAHEMEDLTSFLQLALLNGWGGYVLSEYGPLNVFFSHDEFADFYAEQEEHLADTRKNWDAAEPTSE